MSNLKTIDKEYVANTYARFPLEIVAGKGSLVYDDTGKEYIDMGSGIGVTSFGIADDEWKNAVIEQLGKVQHMSNLYYTEPCARLAEILCRKTGMKKVFFANSVYQSGHLVFILHHHAQESEDKGHRSAPVVLIQHHGMRDAAASGHPFQGLDGIPVPYDPVKIHLSRAAVKAAIFTR